MVNNDNNCEIQFWKVIRNCVLFKKIRYYLLNEISYIPPLKSLLYLFDNNLKNHLFHKIINNHETIFDINLSHQDHIYKLFFLFSKLNKKPQPHKNKTIIKQFYSKLFEYAINNGIKINETLIISNTINTGNLVPLKEYSKLLSIKENKIINCSINNFIGLYTPRTYGQPIIIKTLYHLYKHTSKSNDQLSFDRIIWEPIIKSIDSIYTFFILTKSKEKHGQKTDYESSDHLLVSTYSLNENYYKSVKSSFSFATYLITILSFLPSTETLKNQYMYQLRLLFKLCPIIHNFKIKFLYGICLTYNILQHSGGGVVEFKSMVIPKNEFDSKLSNYNLNMDTYQSRDNIQLIIKEYNKIKALLHPFSRYGDEITALKYGDFKLLKNWYISNQSKQQDRDHLDLVYHGNDINTIVSNAYKQSLFTSLSNLYKSTERVIGISSIRKQSTNCRLTELFELNQHTGKTILFQHCPNQDKQIHFVTQICDEIINNSNQFKLHPLLLLQILIVNDNIELIKIVINKLSNQLSNIKQCNFNVSTSSSEIKEELSLYNPSLVFQNIKSYQVFHYLFKHCNFSTLNINWMKIKGLHLKESTRTSDEPIPEIESISELDHSFSVVGILKNQYIDISISNERQIDHVKNIILNYKHEHKSTVIYYDLNRPIDYFKNLDPLLCIQFFSWVYNHFKTSNNQLILSSKNRDFFNYFVFSFNGDIDNLETHFFKSDINIVTFDQFCEKYNMNNSKTPWSFIKYSIEISDLTILKLIIKHYFDDGIITTNSNRNLNNYINQLLEKQSSKHIKDYLLEYQSVYYNLYSIEQVQSAMNDLMTGIVTETISM